MVRLRHQARSFAVQLLYQAEVGQPGHAGSREDFWQNSGASRKARAFATHLVEATLRHQEQIDPLLRGVLDHWRLERLPVVVRNILRLAVCELRMIREEPAAVVINEALELTRAFMDEDSASFVNGILDQVRRDGEQEAEQDGEAEAAQSR